MAPEFVADFSQAIQFILVPRGTYNVHLANAELGKSNSSGESMLKVRFEIDEVLDMAEDAEYTPDQVIGQSLFSNLMLQGRGAGITQQAFEAMFGDLDEVPSDTEDMVGAYCSVKVTHRVWAVKDGGDGETRANISKYLPAQTSIGSVFG